MSEERHWRPADAAPPVSEGAKDAGMSMTLWDAELEYWAVVYAHETTKALPIALFVHEDEARAYARTHITEAGHSVKVQRRTLERRNNILTLRGGGLPGNPDWLERGDSERG